MPVSARPPAAEEFLEYRLVHLAALLERRFRTALAPVGLTPRQFSVLALLAERPAITAADLARGVLVTPQSMRALVEQLESAGLVERKGTRGKGLATPTSLTTAGRKALDRAFPRVEALDAATRSALGDDYAALTALVVRFERLLDDA